MAPSYSEWTTAATWPSVLRCRIAIDTILADLSQTRCACTRLEGPGEAAVSDELRGDWTTRGERRGRRLLFSMEFSYGRKRKKYTEGDAVCNAKKGQLALQLASVAAPDPLSCFSLSPTPTRLIYTPHEKPCAVAA